MHACAHTSPGSSPAAVAAVCVSICCARRGAWRVCSFFNKHLVSNGKENMEPEHPLSWAEGDPSAPCSRCVNTDGWGPGVILCIRSGASEIKNKETQKGTPAFSLRAEKRLAPGSELSCRIYL